MRAELITTGRARVISPEQHRKKGDSPSGFGVIWQPTSIGASAYKGMVSTSTWNIINIVTPLQNVPIRRQVVTSVLYQRWQNLADSVTHQGVSVKLRIEGKTTTIFEDTVITTFHGIGYMRRSPANKIDINFVIVTD
jgi:ABC-type ATPase involved in cell division